MAMTNTDSQDSYSSSIYVPDKHLIVICSGVEGVWNDGVYECFAATITSMCDMPQYSKLLESYDITEKIHPKEWRELKDDDFKSKPNLGRLWKLFRAQRPKVKVAEDYLFNVLIVNKNPEVIEQFLAEPDNKQAYDPFFNEFDIVASRNVAESKHFAKLFYNRDELSEGAGRPWLQKQDPLAWQGLNEPMIDALQEFRKLVKATREQDIEGAGYAIRFVTTKGEEDTRMLCAIYRTMGLMDEAEYSPEGGRECWIPKDGIIGRESLEKIKEEVMGQIDLSESTPDFEKEFKENITAYQLEVVGKRMGVPFPQLIKLDDIINRKTLVQVQRKHAREIIAPWGYSYKWQLEEARQNDFVDVITENAAHDLGEIVKGWGY
jgi:hypothetical protein